MGRPTRPSVTRKRERCRALRRVRSLLRPLIFLAKPPIPRPLPLAPTKEATLPDVAPPSLWGRGGSRCARAGRGAFCSYPPIPRPLPPTPHQRREGEQIAGGFLPSLVLGEGMPSEARKDGGMTRARQVPLPQRSAQGEEFRVRRSEEHTSELQSRENLVCRLLLEKKKLS